MFAYVQISLYGFARLRNVITYPKIKALNSRRSKAQICDEAKITNYETPNKGHTLIAKSVLIRERRKRGGREGRLVVRVGIYSVDVAGSYRMSKKALHSMRVHASVK